MPSQLGVVKLSKLKYVVFDIETTGFSPTKDRIIQIGAMKLDGKRLIEQEPFSRLVNPERHIPSYITEFTNIDNNRIAREKASKIDIVLSDFFDFAGDRILVAHNGIRFDIKFIEENAHKLGLPQTNFLCVDTMWLSKRLFPDKGLKHNLDALMQRLNVRQTSLKRHDAFGDVVYTAKCFVKMMRILEAKEEDKLILMT